MSLANELFEILEHDFPLSPQPDPDETPSPVRLRRGVSTTYYALFHTLAENCADTLVGSTAGDRSSSSWNKVYRALDHGLAKRACEARLVDKFPLGIRDFASLFMTMQAKRHKADYAPDETFDYVDVVSDVLFAQVASADFWAEPVEQRRAFAVHVLFKPRPSGV